MDFQTYFKTLEMNNNFFSKYHKNELKRYSDNMNSHSVILYDNNIIRKGLRYNRLGVILFKKELMALKVIRGEKHFPQLIDFNPLKLDLYMSYCGVKINKNNIPNDWDKQIRNIVDILIKKSLDLNDIQQKNLCVKNNIIYVIDLADYNIKNNMIFNQIYLKFFSIINNIK